MLKLRDLSGQTQTLPATVRFIEVLSADGKLGAVVFNNNGGVVIVAKPGDPEFDIYSKSWGLLPARHIPMPQVKPA